MGPASAAGRSETRAAFFFLGGGDFSQGGVAFARSLVCFGVCVLLHPRQTSMGRRGWQAIEVPQGWFNVIRGPRPPSVRWPQAQRSHQPVKMRNVSVAPPTKVLGGRPLVQSSNGSTGRQSGPAPTPEEGHGACTPSCNTVGVSHAVVGDPALIPLQEALKKAKAQAATPPLVDRVTASEMHVGRKKKRLEEAEGEVLEAIKRRDVLKAKVVAGEERLAGLKAEVTRAAESPNASPHRC